MNAEADIKKGRKYDQVIAGARDVFMREGYEGASVDEIARDAGVSKATLYSYFPDKQHLFMAVVQEECLQQSGVELAIGSNTMSVRAALCLMCKTLIGFMVSPFGQDTFRVCVAEAKRFPQLGRAFYESGPQRWNRKIGQYLDSPAARAELDIADRFLAADQLAQLCRTDLMLRVMFGIGQPPGEAEIEKIAEEAVEMFLARYARASG